MVGAAGGLRCICFVEEEHDAGGIDGWAGSVADFRGYLAGGGDVAAGFGAAAAFAGGSGEVEAAVSYCVRGVSAATA